MEHTPIIGRAALLGRLYRQENGMNEKEQAAALLREAVMRADKEWENSEKDQWSSGGTWDQTMWGSATVDSLRTWDQIDLVTNRSILVAPEGLSCGTTGCLAGHLVTEAGWRFTISAPESMDDFIPDARVDIGYVQKDGVREAIALVAMDLLEPLGSPRAVPCVDMDWEFVEHDLFNGANRITDVIKIADRMLTMNGLPPTGVSLVGKPEPLRMCKCMGVGQ